MTACNQDLFHMNVLRAGMERSDLTEPVDNQLCVTGSPRIANVGFSEDR